MHQTFYVVLWQQSNEKMAMASTMKVLNQKWGQVTNTRAKSSKAIGFQQVFKSLSIELNGALALLCNGVLKANPPCRYVELQPYAYFLSAEFPCVQWSLVPVWSVTRNVAFC